MYSRPDLTSNNLIHLTKGETPEKALTTLVKILSDKKLLANDGHILGQHKCVCFSEAPLSAIATLMALRAQINVKYQPVGLIVSRKHIYKLGGRPVIYQGKEEYEALPDHLKYRHVTYDPSLLGKEIDFTWEREWRICVNEVPFTPKDVTVILPTRALSDALKAEYSKEWQKSKASGQTIPQEFPWHFIVLEDLGVSLDFPVTSITITEAGKGIIQTSVQTTTAVEAPPTEVVPKTT